MLREPNSTVKILAFVVIGVLAIFAAVYADSATTTVNVSNSAPSFTAGPAENPASTTSVPVNVGSNVTFQATATDANTNQYYLAICKTDGITAGDDTSPTCNSGTWCISSATNSGSQASCNYTVLVGDTNMSYAWYGFVCDKVSGGGSCSSSSQGSGDSGSPFYTNHRPSYSGVDDNGPKNPGQQVTFTATASDSDTHNSQQDQVKLVVCKTEGISGTACDGGAGDTYCTSSFVDSNPTCNYDIPIPTLDDDYTYYAYVFDNFGFEASGHQTDSFSVNNVNPVVSSVALNSGNNITLTENTTTNITITGTVTDNNSCTDLSSVVTSLYRSGITYSGCDAGGESDNNNCYPNVSCSAVGSGNTCEGSSDTSVDYTCTVTVQFHADPTDGGSSDTIYYSQNWLTTIKATDDDAGSGNTEVSTGVEMSSLIALNITGTINYGSLAPGGDSGSSPQSTTATNTGNVGLDIEVSGTTMTGPGTPIPIGNQEYKATTFTYGSGTDLSGTPTEMELNILKTITTGSPATKSLYWGLGIPAGQLSGAYSGSNTIGAVRGEVSEW